MRPFSNAGLIRYRDSINELCTHLTVEEERFMRFYGLYLAMHLVAESTLRWGISDTTQIILKKAAETAFNQHKEDIMYDIQSRQFVHHFNQLIRAGIMPRYKASSNRNSITEVTDNE